MSSSIPAEEAAEADKRRNKRLKRKKAQEQGKEQKKREKTNAIVDNGSFMAKFLAAQAEAEAKGAPVLETAILQVAKPEATTTLAAKTRVDPAVSSANSGSSST